MKFNINHEVKVKLTPLGREILFRKDYYRYHLKEDQEGYSTWQLWVLMFELGQYIDMGRNLPFETEIIIETKE